MSATDDRIESGRGRRSKPAAQFPLLASGFHDNHVLDVQLCKFSDDGRIVTVGVWK